MLLKKVLALVLALMLAVGCLGITAMAEDTSITIEFCKVGSGGSSSAPANTCYLGSSGVSYSPFNYVRGSFYYPGANTNIFSKTEAKITATKGYYCFYEASKGFLELYLDQDNATTKDKSITKIELTGGNLEYLKFDGGSQVGTSGAKLTSWTQSFSGKKPTETVKITAAIDNTTVINSFTVYWGNSGYNLTSTSEGVATGGGVTFKVGDTEVNSAAEGAEVTATANTVDGYTAVLSCTEGDVTLSPDPNTGTVTFTMPAKNVTIKATYTETNPPTLTFTAKAPEPEFYEGTAVEAAVIGTVAAENFSPTYSATVVDKDDGTGTEVTDKNISATMDGTNVKVTTTADTPEGTYYIRITGTDSSLSKTKYAYATVTVQSAISGTKTLDLDDDTTEILASTSIDQKYKKTTSSSDQDNNKIEITWESAPVVQITVTDAKKWNPTSLQWEADTENANNGKATMTENSNVIKFTLRNYSPVAFNCTMAFAAAEGMGTYLDATTPCAFDEKNGTKLDAVDVDSSTKKALAKYFDGDNIKTSALPTLEITATLNVKASAFDGKAATDSNTDFGSFTITCAKVTE